MNIKKFISVFGITVLSSCNFYSWAESDGNSYSRCKDEADKGHVNKAIEICEAVLASIEDAPDSCLTNDLCPDINTELGDLYLRKVGMSLPYLADIAFGNQNCTGISCFILFSEELLKLGKVNDANKEDVFTALEKFEAVSNYWSENGQAAKVKATNFFITLAQISKLVYLLASTNIDDGAAAYNDLLVTSEDICNAEACNDPISQDPLFATLPDPELLPCLNLCDGISDIDAEAVFDLLKNLSTLLGESFGIDQMEENINLFLNQEVLHPSCFDDPTSLDPVNCPACITNPDNNGCKVTIGMYLDNGGKAQFARKIIHKVLKDSNL